MQLCLLYHCEGTELTWCFFPQKKDRITLEALLERYDSPLSVVAKEFDVCLTHLKRVCRSHGIMRWPYRKVVLPSRAVAPSPRNDAHPSMASADQNAS